MNKERKTKWKEEDWNEMRDKIVNAQRKRLNYGSVIPQVDYGRAYAEYAKALGKDVQYLTDNEKRQTILNVILSQGEENDE